MLKFHAITINVLLTDGNSLMKYHLETKFIYLKSTLTSDSFYCRQLPLKHSLESIIKNPAKPINSNLIAPNEQNREKSESNKRKENPNPM